MQEDAFQFYEFGPFRLNVNDRLLERNRALVALTPKVFDMLLLLVEHSGHVLDKNDLIESLWPDSFVEESSLTQNISLLRRALGEGGSENQYIQTIPKRGYRFVGSVQEVRLSSSELKLQERSSAEVLRNSEPEQGNSVPTPTAPMLLSEIPGKRWLLIAAGSLIVFITSLVVFSLHKRQSLNELMGARSLAILPFQTIGPNKEELFGLGMADAIIVRLSGPDRPTVLPTSSVLKYTTRDKNTPAIGKELGVDAVLDGTLQREGDQVRVTVQLIRSSDGQVLWSGKFDEYYRSSFALQDSLADHLAGALALKNPDNTHDAQR
jgi:DNA-binding winged helix-turn-helix (wHTH) protein/TolB-like protein